MKHRISAFLGLLVVVGLVACQSPTPEATPTQSEPTATATSVPPSPAPTDTTEPTTEPATDRSGSTPTPSWQIPEVRPGEWTTGGADAGLILVEYSDFQ